MIPHLAPLFQSQFLHQFLPPRLSLPECKPQIECSVASPPFPRASEELYAIHRWLLTKAVETLNCLLQTHVRRRQTVEVCQGSHPDVVCGPGSHSFLLEQTQMGHIRFQFAQSFKVQRSEEHTSELQS